MDSRPPINEKGSIVIIACRVMVPELEKARDQDSGVEIRYLDQGLHRTPDKMAGLIQAQIAALLKKLNRKALVVDR